MWAVARGAAALQIVVRRARLFGVTARARLHVRLAAVGLVTLNTSAMSDRGARVLASVAGLAALLHAAGVRVMTAAAVLVSLGRSVRFTGVAALASAGLDAGVVREP